MSKMPKSAQSLQRGCSCLLQGKEDSELEIVQPVALLLHRVNLTSSQHEVLCNKHSVVKAIDQHCLHHESVIGSHSIAACYMTGRYSVQDAK